MSGGEIKSTGCERGELVEKPLITTVDASRWGEYINIMTV